MTLTTLPLSDPYGTLSYRVAGQDARAQGRAPLVLLHGVGMQSAAWGPQIAALSVDQQVYALDLPGHGGTSPLAEGSDLADFVDWLAAALTALDLGAVNLAGHSMGALIAGGMAVRHPGRVKRVALLNGVFRRGADARAAVLARADLISGGSFDLDTPLKRWFSNNVRDSAARVQVAGWLSQVDLGGYVTAYRAFARDDAMFADGFGDIACPLLALTGADDPNSTPEMSRAMADAAPQGQAVVIPGHRHMVNLTAPEAVNESLTNWLNMPSQDGTLQEASLT